MEGLVTYGQCPYKEGRAAAAVTRQMKGQERTEGKRANSILRRGLSRERESANAAIGASSLQNCEELWFRSYSPPSHSMVFLRLS